MSQQVHDLMESVTADDQAITVPASPPRRDSIEDADSSLTRKRPRLDNGTTDNRAMSTDPTPATQSTASPRPADQLVEMTIRSQPPSSSQPSAGPAEPNEPVAPMAATEEEGVPAVETAEDQLLGDDNDVPEDSPPVIAVDSDDDTEDALGDYADDYIHIQHGAEEYFRRFPFATPAYHGNYSAALRQMIQHFQGANVLDGTVLPQISIWLDSFPHRRAQWKSYYFDRGAFWDEFAAFVNKILVRRYPFGDTFCDDSQSEDEVFYNFFRSYLRLCARLFQVDADLLSTSTLEGINEQQLLSYRHLRHVNTILREEKSLLFHLLGKEYGADIRDMGRRLLSDFIGKPINGLKQLFAFADAACNKVTPSAKNGIATWVTQVATSVGWYLLDLPDVEKLTDRSQFYRDLLHYFRSYNEDLQAPSKITDVGVAKDLIGHFSTLLSDMCQWDDSLAAELADELLDFGDPDSPTFSFDDEETKVRIDSFRQDAMYRPALVSNAWKFKLLRKYVVKGRMELRVMSIGTMDNALVDIWREYSISAQGTNHQVMQYLADFLLHEQVIEYIISVDSHPQLISRSGNIVGFLVVTRRYSEHQTDAIWRTVSNSQDPRVVAATLTMLRSITGLMDSPELLYLCTKLYHLPIDNYNLDILRFLRDISEKLRQKMFEWANTDYEARPWNVCIRMIQDTSPSRESTKQTIDLHREACDQLRFTTSSISPEERQHIYTGCIKHIANRSSKATGSIKAIHILCSNAMLGDASYFKQNLDAARHIVEELCSFIQAENDCGFHAHYIDTLDYRLEMLRFLVLRATEAIPSDLYLDIWDHVVGKYALSNFVRDKAWPKFSEAVKHRPENDFCKQLILSYVPNLEPEYFTVGLYQFVATYRFPTTRRLISTDDGEKELLQIRGADLLWRMVLNAPPGTVEDAAAKLLASRYVEVDTDQGVSVEEVEDAHVALVEKCTEEVLSAYKTLRNKSTNEMSLDAGDSMEVVLPDNTRQQTEQRFSRTLLFEKLLLQTIRTRPEFSRTPRSDSKVDIFEPEVTHGDAIEITYTSTNEKQTIFMGTKNTLHDLETRLCSATGFTKINLFGAGQRLNLMEKGQKTLGELGLGPKTHFLVQKAAGSETHQPSPASGASYSVFEMTVLSHFEELFACMDSDDYLSQVLFDFLSIFPWRERIADDVAAGKTSANDLFPPGKIFQAKYAAHALQSKLREHLRRNTLDETFLLNAVQLLDHAILNSDLLSDSLSGRNELHLATVLVNILLEFLKERPGQDISSQYFSNEAMLVERLTKFLSVALKAPYDSSMAVSSSYAAILEASLHSRRVWEAFVNRAEISVLHQALLLTDPRKLLREHVAKTIASVCGGDLPSTSPLTGAETAEHFWAIISSVLPTAVQYPSQSEQLFQIAEQVFRRYDENNRDEDSLRTCLVSWSDLLLHYKHNEFVGRDEVDYVVLGFTKLLLCCIPSLKSFKKPLNVGPLIEQLFRKFLFVPKVFEIDDEESSYVRLPVLESNTRKELYDLMLALAEDRNSYNTLLNLAETLASDDEIASARSYGVDRANEIRSCTGYVGLVNPRAICYMNSLMTQLFMNVNFRKFMLSLDVADAGASQRLLSETQKLFAIMQNTFRKSADPREFAACVKGLDGQSIDINIQMDADEFYNLLFDQWEGQMLSPETKQRFRSFYGGQTVNQIKSKECEHVSERVESFFVVQCDVQGKANLQESLQAFIEGDVMEGDNKYKCESCGGKFVDAVKRTCLKDVPDNLIFHLKRFDFDLVDMRRAKINDHFAFPEQIDVSPYNVEHLSDPSKPRQEDIFELVGVLIHQGTSENGHYYSYIRERPCPSGSMTNWVEFNDRDVDTFDHQTIPFHAFGGFFDEFQRNQKQFSAYMLFYQRKSAIEKDHQEYISSPHCGSPKVRVPSKLEAAISADNEAFVREYSLHDPNHSKFVRQILTTLKTVNHGSCSEDHQQEAQAFHVVLDHLCQTISRQRFIEQFDETMSQLRRTAFSCSACCHIALKWLATDENALIGLILRCPHMKIRSQVRAFITDGLHLIRDKDPVLYFGADNMDNDNDVSINAPVDGILVDIVQRLRAVADESWISARGWDDLYLTLFQISLAGHIETAVLLNHEILEFGLKILSMHACPQFRNSDPDIWRLVEKKKHIYNRLIELIYALLSRIDIRLAPVGTSAQSIDRLTHYDKALSRFPLSQLELNCLCIWDESNRALAVLDRMIEWYDCSKAELFYPGEVLKWMLMSNENAIQRRLHHTVFEGITSLNPGFSDPYIRAAIPYCEACPEATFVANVADAVAKGAATLRDAGGEVHLLFLNALCTIENDNVFEERGSDLFLNYALYRSRAYAVPLLLYEDDIVRKMAAAHLEMLFTKVKDEDATEDSLKHKYTTIRRLAQEMNKKIIIEHDNGSSRNYMQPLISTCNLLVNILFQLDNNDDPEMLSYKTDRETAIIVEYQSEVVPRLNVWALDEGTPISTGEAYEQSDYASESDEGPDLEP